MSDSLGVSRGRIFQKLGEPGWKAWVPVVNTITILELGGYTALWVIAAFVPVLNVVAAVIIILAINGINARLGKGGGYTALFVFLAPVWAGHLGFGKTGPGGVSGALPNRFEQVSAPASAGIVRGPVAGLLPCQLPCQSPDPSPCRCSERLRQRSPQRRPQWPSRTPPGYPRPLGRSRSLTASTSRQP